MCLLFFCCSVLLILFDFRLVSLCSVLSRSVRFGSGRCRPYPWYLTRNDNTVLAVRGVSTSDVAVEVGVVVMDVIRCGYLCFLWCRSKFVRPTPLIEGFAQTLSTILIMIMIKSSRTCKVHLNTTTTFNNNFQQKLPTHAFHFSLPTLPSLMCGS